MWTSVLVSANLSQDLTIRRLPLLSSCLMSWNQMLLLLFLFPLQLVVSFRDLYLHLTIIQVCRDGLLTLALDVYLPMSDIALTFSVLSFPLHSSLLSLGKIFAVHSQCSFSKMLLPSFLALHVLTIDLIESTQICKVSSIDIVIQNMHSTLLILIHVIVQVILRSGYHVSNG